MFAFLSRKFIKNNEAYDNINVRQKYGVLCSIVSIGCNILLVIFKISMGVITNSIAIQADGLNNLSDVGSNIASLFGFKLANKHPDEDHPYGHGRMEYIAGLVIAFLIILVGLQALKDSVLKIITPEPVRFSILACVLLIVSILIKLWMCTFNRSTGKKIQSSTLLAAGQDSLNDVVTTSATLLSLVLSLYTTLPVDGIFGAIVSLIVLKSGYEVFKDTVDPLLGKAPDKALIANIESYICSYKEVLGIHDLMMHDYGPGRSFLTLHVEVNGKGEMMHAHDVIDQIERSVLKKFQVLTTIHMDPVDTKDERSKFLQNKVANIVKEINPNYSIHDFRIAKEATYTNLIFDVLVPLEDEIPHEVLEEKINEKINITEKDLVTVIQIDHSYV